MICLSWNMSYHCAGKCCKHKALLLTHYTGPQTVVALNETMLQGRIKEQYNGRTMIAAINKIHGRN